MSTEDGNYVTREAQDEYIFSQMRVSKAAGRGQGREGGRELGERAGSDERPAKEEDDDVTERTG